MTRPIAASILILFAGSSSVTASDVTFRTVVLTGDPVPGDTEGRVFSDLFDITLNGAGETAGGAGTQFSDGTGGFAVGWTEGGGGVFRQAVPLGTQFDRDGNTLTVRSVRSLFLTDDGQTTLQANVLGVPGQGSASPIALMTESPNNTFGVLFVEDLDEVVPGQVVSSGFFGIAGYEGGGVVSECQVSGPGITTANDRAALAVDPLGAPVVLLREGDTIDFGVSGAEVSSIATRFSTPSTPLENSIVRVTSRNPTGLTAYVTHLTAAQPTVIAKTGDPAAGIGSFTTLDDITVDSGGFGTDGELLYRAELIGSSVTSANDQAMFRWDPVTGPELLMRKGDAVPGGMPGESAAFIFNGLSSSSGTAILTVVAVGGTETAFVTIAFPSQGAPSVLFRSGAPAEGLPQSVMVSSVLNDLELNAFDQLAGIGRLEGPGVSSSANNDDALLATDVLGRLVLLAREGDVFDVNDDPSVEDLRTIAGIQLEGLGGPIINDAGQVAFILEFTDGSEGAFVAQIPVPLTLCAADFDADGDVDLGDFGIFGGAFGTAAGDPSFLAAADIDCDNDVDLGDFGLFGGEFGRTDCLP